MSENRYTAEEICAKLTTCACRRDQIPQLEYNERLRMEVKDILNQAGYEFIDDPISKHYDARIKEKIRNLNDLFENELGYGLTKQAKALMVILWCQLILPKYDSTLKKELTEEPSVTEEQLYENYKIHIGAKKNLKKVLTILRHYGFIKTLWGRNSTLVAGPRLTTALNSFTMYNLVKGKIIDFLVEENEKNIKDIDTMYENLSNETNYKGGTLSEQ